MKNSLKKIVIFCVNKYAEKVSFFFPDSFLWKWKLSYLLHQYELETTRFFRKNIKPGMIVVDIGANIGYFTRLFSDLVGPEGMVYAFEPDEENWNFLQKNISGRRNVKAFKEAVSNSDGQIDFYHVTGMTGTHTILPVDFSEKRTVRSQTLDTFVKSENVAKIDFIKIDVEGAEEQVFGGMTSLLDSNNKPVVVFEYTPDTSKDFLEKLRSDYSLWSIKKNGLLQSLDKIIFRKGKRAYANVVLNNSFNDKC